LCVGRPSAYVCFSVCRLSHSCTLLNPFDGMRCHLAETLMWFQVTLYQTGAAVLHGKGRLGVGTHCQKLHCKLRQIVTDSGMVTADSVYELSNALSNGTIADPIRFTFPQITRSQQCCLAPNDFGCCFYCATSYGERCLVCRDARWNISRWNIKKFRGNFEIFQDPFFEMFREIFNFHYKAT